MASYVHLENKNTFFIIHSNLLLLNLQKYFDPPCTKLYMLKSEYILENETRKIL